ncbi:MDR family NADP-dependent oxidoreductase [Streptomyces hoynatensis]|uniref:NADP-dependent oxidoreductase n=1 Tax=Streptomyces hoynatensis TaxID=1141874 RepID=A0A3A9Z335_9ACTN|nr:NADP-dependent oxidoreductase [Streptomyces hoynatensis]RKN41737.1 NADP-dependent oxidoreductase [Streptomyces hoynatensis]
MTQAPPPIPDTHRELRLAARPKGLPGPEHFELAETAVPRPGPGEVLVRNRLMSLVTVMHSLMDEHANLPMPAFSLGEPPWGPVVGEVVRAPADGPFAVGDLVAHRASWREYAVVAADAARRVDPEVLPDPAWYLSSAVTAWLGVVKGAEVREGDTVFVSGAAGAVGSLAGQLARLRGAARVIGSTGSRRKGEYLRRELGYDAVVHRGEGEPPIEEQLRAAAPEGLDAVFDNVGGEQLRAALAVARPLARVALIGALAGQVPGGAGAKVEIEPFSLIGRSITLRALGGVHWLSFAPEAEREVGRAARAGKLRLPQARLRGIAQAPAALRELLEGRHIGQVLVEL